MNARAKADGVASTVFVGLGSNLEQPLQQLQRAIEELAAIPGTELLKVSSFYETAPVGIVDQPMFFNAVAMLKTRLSPQDFLQHLLSVEAEHARQRIEKNGPRTLDLDVLIFGDLQNNETSLVVPHPRMHERAFVLVPLLEIAPEVKIPGIGAASECLPKVGSAGVRRVSNESGPTKSRGGNQR